MHLRRQVDVDALGAALSVVICIALWQSREGTTVGTFASGICQTVVPS